MTHRAAARSRRLPPALTTPRTEPVTYRLRVDLDHMKPPVWRRLDVDAAIDLESLHLVLQAAFGWDNSHLHLYRRSSGPRAVDDLVVSDVEYDLPDALPEHEVTLDQLLTAPGDSLGYTYDLGDSWEHTIALEKVLPPADDVAVLVTGRQAAPFEDGEGLYDEDGELLEEPREREFDLAALQQAVADLFEDDDEDDDELDEEAEALLEEIGSISPAAVARAARSTPLLARLRAAATEHPAAAAGGPDGLQHLTPGQRDLLRAREEHVLAALAAAPAGTPAKAQLDAMLRGSGDDADLGSAVAVLSMHTAVVLRQWVDLDALLSDPEGTAADDDGRRALAYLELLAALGSHAEVDLLDMATVSLDGPTVMAEGPLLAGAGLATLDGGSLRVDPDLRPALLMALPQPEGWGEG